MLDEILRKNLLTMAGAMAKHRGSTLGAVSRAAHGDYNTFDKLASGKGSITARKYDDAMAYFHDAGNWPKGVTPPRIHEPWRRVRRKPGVRNGKAKEGRRCS